jgi:hypothetical protein
MKPLRGKQLERSSHDPALILFNPAFTNSGHCWVPCFSWKLTADYMLLNRFTNPKVTLELR